MDKPQSTFNGGPLAKPLWQTFNDLCTDYKKQSIDGSIELHFNNGVIAKLFERRVHKP